MGKNGKNQVFFDIELYDSKMKFIGILLGLSGFSVDPMVIVLDVWPHINFLGRASNLATVTL